MPLSVKLGYIPMLTRDVIQNVLEEKHYPPGSHSPPGLFFHFPNEIPTQYHVVAKGIGSYMDTQWMSTRTSEIQNIHPGSSIKWHLAWIWYTCTTMCNVECCTGCPPSRQCFLCSCPCRCQGWLFSSPWWLWGRPSNFYLTSLSWVKNVLAWWYGSYLQTP